MTRLQTKTHKAIFKNSNNVVPMHSASLTQKMKLNTKSRYFTHFIPPCTLLMMPPDLSLSPVWTRFCSLLPVGHQPWNDAAADLLPLHPNMRTTSRTDRHTDRQEDGQTGGLSWLLRTPPRAAHRRVHVWWGAGVGFRDQAGPGRGGSPRLSLNCINKESVHFGLWYNC